MLRKTKGTYDVGRDNGTEMSTSNSQVFTIGIEQIAEVVIVSNPKPKKMEVILLIASLAASQYFTYQSSFILSSFYSNYCESRGISGVVIGFILGIPQGVAIVAVYAQIWLMNFVSPKTELVAGLVIAGLCSIAMGFTDMIEDNATFLGVSMTLRIVQGIGIMATDVSVFVIANKETPLKHLSKAMGVLEALLAISIAIASPLGGLLYGDGRFYLSFVVSGVLCLMDALFMALFLKKKEHEDRFTVWSLLSQTFSFPMMKYLYHFLVFGALVGFFGEMIEPHLRRFKLNAASVGAIILITNGIEGLTFPIWGIILDKTEKFNAVLFCGYSIILLGFIFFGPFPGLPDQLYQLPALFVSLALCGTGISALSVSAFILGKIQLLKLCGSENLASVVVSAAYIGVSNLGITLGDLLGGSFVDVLGYRVGSALWMIVLLIGISIQVVFLIKNRNN